MDISSHPSVEEVRRAVNDRGGNLACNVCRHEDFALEQITALEAGGGYGAHRLKRADLVCENCGHVMGFELDKLRSSEG